METDEFGASDAGTGFNAKLGFGDRPALVLIDLVQAYFVESAPLYHPDFRPALEASVRLKEEAQRIGIPIVVTRVEVQKGGVGGGVFFEKIKRALVCFEPGNPLGDFPATLRIEPSDIVLSKRYASAFFGTPLAATLTALAVDTVLLCGVSTSGCVRASCVDAISSGFRPMVVREAVGDRHPAIQESNLYDMNAKYADVISEAEALAYLRALPSRQPSAVQKP